MVYENRTIRSVDRIAGLKRIDIVITDFVAKILRLESR